MECLYPNKTRKTLWAAHETMATLTQWVWIIFTWESIQAE